MEARVAISLIPRLVCLRQAGTQRYWYCFCFCLRYPLIHSRERIVLIGETKQRKAPESERIMCRTKTGLPAMFYSALVYTIVQEEARKTLDGDKRP